MQAVAAEEHVRDAADPGDLELHGGLEHADVARGHQHGLARWQVVGGDPAAELDPGPAIAVQLLQDEAVTAIQAGPEALLQGHAHTDARRTGQPAVPVHHVRVPAGDVDRHDVTGNLGREGDRARPLVLGEEQAAAADHSLQAAHEPAAATTLA